MRRCNSSRANFDGNIYSFMCGQGGRSDPEPGQRDRGPGQHRRAARPAKEATQSPAPALTVISGYSAATASLFTFDDGLADVSGTPC